MFRKEIALNYAMFRFEKHSADRLLHLLRAVWALSNVGITLFSLLYPSLTFFVL